MSKVFLVWCCNANGVFRVEQHFADIFMRGDITARVCPIAMRPSYQPCHTLRQEHN